MPVEGRREPERQLVRVADVSNAEINRELQALKRIFSLAIKDGRIAMRPHIPLLREDNVRVGFFEPDQLASVLSPWLSRVGNPWLIRCTLRG